MSDKQREANRRNGALGGPKTLEGKEITRLNALRHGLTAQKLVLNSEDQELFEGMLQGYVNELKPQGLEQTDLVREVVACKWRQERFWHIECAIIDLSIAETEPAIAAHFNNIDAVTKAAFSFVQQHGHVKALEMVGRYESRMRRLQEKARRDLDRLQTPKAPKPVKETKSARPAAPPEPGQDEPLSYLSFISKEEFARLNKGKNEPKFDLDLHLPETNPFDKTNNKEPKTPKAA